MEDNKPAETNEQDVAMDPDFFQKLMHTENQRRLIAVEGTQQTMLKTLTEIADNTKDLPKLIERVDDLEASRDKFKAGMAVVLALGPVADWAMNRIFFGGGVK
jgi:hypothetical protein